MSALSTAKPFWRVNAEMLDQPAPDTAFLPFPQSDTYAVAMRALGATVFTCDLGIGQAQVVQRGRLRLISRGPDWQRGTVPDDARKALRRMARWAGVTLVTPETNVQGPGLIPVVTPMHHAIWDLSGDPRARMRRNWRSHLACAERAGITPVRGGAETLDLLVAHDASQARARRYAGHTRAFTHALPQQHLRLWSWQIAGRIEAAMAFVVHGSSASYHLGWAGQTARASGVHNMMLWQAALALRGEGIRWLDLGSVNDEDAPGLAHFKLGTGAALRQLGHTLLVLPR
jgi:hypothetical protein